MTPGDPLELWLDAADFELFDVDPLVTDDAVGVSALAEDPWAGAVADPPPLSDAQRSFIDDTSPAFGAALTANSLSGEAPFAGLDEQSVAEADDQVMDFDDED